MFGLITVIATLLDWLIWQLVLAGVLSRSDLVKMISSRSETISQEVLLSLTMIVVYLVVTDTATVQGNSMSPTLKDKDTVTYVRSMFIWRWSRWYNKGDIILFESANAKEYDHSKTSVDVLVKRIHSQRDTCVFGVMGDNVDITVEGMEVHAKDIIGRVVTAI